MKTDAQLKHDVVAELAWDPAIDADGIGVAVHDGVVTVSGHLETYAEKHAVERALGRVAGVEAIALELDVRLSPQHRRSDTEIAAAAESALQWHTAVPHEQVQITVERGWVRLLGVVDWEHQRRAVEQAIRPLAGVTGISNELRLKPRPTPADLASRIEGALQRQALRGAQRVEIDVDDGRVTLRGCVHSRHEREAACGAAWSAPGVRAVVDQLRVGD